MRSPLPAAKPQSLQLIDSSVIRAHQHAAGGKKGVRVTPSAVLVEDKNINIENSKYCLELCGSERAGAAGRLTHRR
jgi:hypothetical protein